MTGPSAYRKGWCPGALRPMASGDGLIVRLRITGGAIAPDLGRALARCALEFGNELLDLSARANLQLRGVTEPNLLPLQAALDALGLLDADPAIEAVRNVMASPLAGFDPAAPLDIRPSIHALEDRLRSDPSLHRLPGKFGFLIDDGGRLPLAPGAADVAFLARPGRESPYFEIRLGGKISGICAVDDLAETAARIARSFLNLRGSSADAPGRMAALIQRVGAAAVARAAGIGGMPESGLDRPVPQARPIGAHALGRYSGFGVGIPFGRLSADALRLLADEADAASGELRLTPWRAILIVGERIDSGFADRMRRAGFVLEEDAPVRAVAACPGAPHCPNGSTSPHADGTRLASLARRLSAHGVTLHVSGCQKGCAHPRTASVTLVARNGAYDLVLDGSASDDPVIGGLDVARLEWLLQRLIAVAPGERRSTAHQFAAERRQ
jgi:precorrin-3B synthase